MAEPQKRLRVLISCSDQLPCSVDVVGDRDVVWVSLWQRHVWDWGQTRPEYHDIDKLFGRPELPGADEIVKRMSSLWPADAERALALDFADVLVPRSKPIEDTLAAANAICEFLNEWPNATFKMKEQALGIAFKRYLDDGEAASVERSLSQAQVALAWLVNPSSAVPAEAAQPPAGAC